MNPTRFFESSDIIIPTMEKIDGVDTTIGAIVTNRYHVENKYIDVWEDPNPFQSEICSYIVASYDIEGTIGCQNPIVPEYGVDKNLIDIGASSFNQEGNNIYNESTFPFKRASIEYVDLYELVQDNHTGNSQSMSGTMGFANDLSELEQYDKKEEIETDYVNCLKFKTETEIQTSFNLQGETIVQEKYINLSKIYSYKEDVCTDTDTINTPPKYIKGEYCHDGCNCEKDKMLHVRKCGDIINNNTRATSLANHTCADIELEKIFESSL